MKKYVKPALMALELEANSALCGTGCSANKENEDFVQYLMTIAPDADWSKYFATAEGCANDPIEIGIVVDGYCKYTAANIIFIS